MKYPIFYFWLKNIETGEKMLITSLNYYGDIGEFIDKNLIIIDWTYEMREDVV